MYLSTLHVKEQVCLPRKKMFGFIVQQPTKNQQMHPISFDRYEYAPTIPLNEKQKGYVQETNETVSKCHCTTSP